MSHYLAFKSLAGCALGGDPDDSKTRFVLVREEDIKRGIVVPSRDPMIEHEPAYILEAGNVEEAKHALAERIARPAFG